jgi:pyruvyltransferase
MLIDHENKTINVWWMNDPEPGNFGDILTPWLIRAISGYEPNFIYQRWSDGQEATEDQEYIAPQFIGYWEEVLLGVGSILDFTSGHTTVWGSGIIKQTTNPSVEANYLAVRGPLTRDLLLSHNINCPDIFGDPALLMPRFYKRKTSPKYPIGIFVHYVDYEQAMEWYGDHPYIKIINPLNADITKVLDELFLCEKVISSSLHGIIVANAYGIPVTWAKFSNKLYGDDSKFHDHFAAIGVQHNYMHFYEKISPSDLHKLNYFVSPEFDSTPLLQAFPVQR